MKIDEKTLLITDFGDIDVSRLLEATDKCALHGEITPYFRCVFSQWRDLCEFHTDQKFVMMQTHFAARVYRSVLQPTIECVAKEKKLRDNYERQERIEAARKGGSDAILALTKKDEEWLDEQVDAGTARNEQALRDAYEHDE